MSHTEYDIIVIGAGPAGENAAAAGLRTAIVERELAGGECSYWACMPSKALLRPGEVLAAARRVPGAAHAVTGDIDIQAALARRDALAGNWDDAGQVEWPHNHDVDFIRGHGRLVGERTVTVTDDGGNTATYVVSTAVVVATGTGADVPPVDGLRDICRWDNRDITAAKEVPRRLLIIGGGVVGVEMAQAWKTLGAEEETIVEVMPALLPREEPFAGEELKGGTRADRHRGVHGHSARRSDQGRRRRAGHRRRRDGRRPLTADLGLETVGFAPGEYIEVDDRMRATGVAAGWLCAVGDVNGRALLTHTGKYQARIAGDHIAGRDVTAWGDVTAVPRVVFTDPQMPKSG